jgi:hypothetical protein
MAERPVPADAVKALEAHIFRRYAPAQSGPVPGRAAGKTDVALQVGARIRPFQLKVLLGLFFPAGFEMRRPRFRRIRRIPMKQPQARRQVPVILDDAPAIHARAGFEHQHGQTGVQRSFCDQATDHPGSHDDDICAGVIRHLNNPLSLSRAPHQNSGILLRGGASADQPFGPETA